MDISMAALQLAHEAGAGAAAKEEAEIPPPAEAAPKPKKKTARSKPAKPKQGMARIFVGAGRKANMRPADLVGAIVNEAGIEAKTIGAIEIGDTFSLVELPEPVTDAVIAALRATKVKGKRLTVRRDKAGGRK